VSPEKASLSEIGLHGNHCTGWSEVGQIPTSILSQVRNSARGPTRSALESFTPDTVRVAFETMHGRKIGNGQTLCGWSKDGDAVQAANPDAKLLVMLGSSKVTIGFKYDKADRQALEVDLMPGDILALYGPARTWVSAVCAVQTGVGRTCPFDFAHIWFCDHRPLKRARPDVYERIHSTAMPRPGDMSYKWMQYTYEVVGPSGDGEPEVMVQSEASMAEVVSNRKVVLRSSSAVNVDGPERSKTGRRWKGRGSSGYYCDQAMVGA